MNYWRNINVTVFIILNHNQKIRKFERWGGGTPPCWVDKILRIFKIRKKNFERTSEYLNSEIVFFVWFAHIRHKISDFKKQKCPLWSHFCTIMVFESGIYCAHEYACPYHLIFQDRNRIRLLEKLLRQFKIFSKIMCKIHAKNCVREKKFQKISQIFFKIFFAKQL